MPNLRKHANEIFEHVLGTLDPNQLVKKKVSIRDSTLMVEEREYDLDNYENIYVVGGGKACAPMAKAMEDLLGDKIDDGLIVVKYNHSLPLKKIETVEASHPIPDKDSVRGTSNILRLLSKTGEKDLIICLISGGGSALLVQPHKEITLPGIQIVSAKLFECGASIDEINTVRKHLSSVKGGQLAKAAYPSTLITLMLSDVVGDPMDIIASGPTVPDESTFEDAYKIIRKYSLEEKILNSVYQFLRSGKMGKVEETPKTGNEIFDNTQNVIVGSNKIALDAAEEKAKDLGYNTIVLSSLVEGESREIAKFFAAIAKEVSCTGTPVPKPACIIAGGETTVTIKGKGKGGRNQEFALSAAMEIEGCEGVVILSAGTDGTDGPTDATGAIVDYNTCKGAREKLSQKPEEFLNNNDSYNFFKKTREHIVTGPTMTNVMDIMISLID
ncbi:MAG: glycerate kinase [Candidatus Scalindua sp.]|jgi:hydroxypyruvate reductase|nr:glycerate kinase [Candidatus Scalindua sp.]MDV5166616.1 glycerate kinase [Candidatus Scalindua sp.]